MTVEVEQAGTTSLGAAAAPPFSNAGEEALLAVFRAGEVSVEEQHARIDALELAMLGGHVRGAELAMPGYVHRFVPGLYLREITMLHGMVHTTKVHGSHHAFVVLSGEAWVASPGREPVHYVAPFVGETRPGTRRVVYSPEECRWMTLHPLTAEEEAARQAGATQADLVAAVEARIMVRRELAGGKTAFELFRERVDEQLAGGERVLYHLPEAEAKQVEVAAFRDLTARVIAAEKPGTWSDWTPEEQAFYEAGDWKAFSRSRGYSASEIAEYDLWRSYCLKEVDAGRNPYSLIADLAKAAAERNIALDTRGEIEKSSHAPHEKRGRE